jgi:hypothetical protein
MLSTIDLDNPPARQRSLPGPLRRFALTTATVLAAVLLIAYAMAAEPPPAPQAPSETAPAAPAPLPRLVAPASVAAGSTVVVLVYRDFDLCGPTKVRLDGTPLEVATMGSAAPANHSWVSIQIPAHTSGGTHRIELYGPISAAGGVLCGRTPERQSRIATARITVHAP